MPNLMQTALKLERTATQLEGLVAVQADTVSELRALRADVKHLRNLVYTGVGIFVLGGALLGFIGGAHNDQPATAPDPRRPSSEVRPVPVHD